MGEAGGEKEINLDKSNYRLKRNNKHQLAASISAYNESIFKYIHDGIEKEKRGKTAPSVNYSRDSKIKGSECCGDIKQLLSIRLLEIKKVEVALS